MGTTILPGTICLLFNTDCELRLLSQAGLNSRADHHQAGRKLTIHDRGIDASASAPCSADTSHRGHAAFRGKTGLRGLKTVGIANHWTIAMMSDGMVMRAPTSTFDGKHQGAVKISCWALSSPQHRPAIRSRMADEAINQYGICMLRNCGANDCPPPGLCMFCRLATFQLVIGMGL